MRFKDSPEIPLPVLKALKSDAYRESLEAHFKDLPPNIKGKFSHTMSVTTLARSARQVQLTLRHANEILVDPLERRHALMGRITHTILEENKGPGDIAEERLGIVYPLSIKKRDGVEVIPYWVHGAADLYNYQTGELDDYKTPKTGSLKYGKGDYHAQLNILAYIWRKNGRKVTSLWNIYLLLKDWNPQYVREDDPDHEYPKSWIVKDPIPMWSDEKCMEYLTERLTKHYLNESRPDDDLDHCDDEELWRSDPLYKVYKLEEDGQRQKTAKYNGPSKEIAQQTMEALSEAEKKKIIDKNGEKKKPKPESDLVFPKYELVELPSSPRRCAFCDVRNRCSQRIAQLVAEMETGIQSTEEHEEGGE